MKFKVAKWSPLDIFGIKIELEHDIEVLERAFLVWKPFNLFLISLITDGIFVLSFDTLCLHQVLRDIHSNIRKIGVNPMLDTKMA